MALMAVHEITESLYPFGSSIPENGTGDQYCFVRSFNLRHAEPDAKVNVVWSPGEVMRFISAVFAWRYA